GGGWPEGGGGADGSVRSPQGGGADRGGEVQGERAVLREAGADSTAERASGRGPAARGALPDTRHGEQPGPEWGSGRDRCARRRLGGLMGLLGRLRCAGFWEAVGALLAPGGTTPPSPPGTAGTAVWVVIRVLRTLWTMRASLPQGLVEGLLVQAGGVDGVAAAPLRHGEPAPGAARLLGHP